MRMIQTRFKRFRRVSASNKTPGFYLLNTVFDRELIETRFPKGVRLREIAPYQCKSVLSLLSG